MTRRRHAVWRRRLITAGSQAEGAPKGYRILEDAERSPRQECAWSWVRIAVGEAIWFRMRLSMCASLARFSLLLSSSYMRCQDVHRGMRLTHLVQNSAGL